MVPSPDKPSWPKRAVVTAGMPYGNKPLHFGHIAGVFVPADCYARFFPLSAIAQSGRCAIDLHFRKSDLWVMVRFQPRA